MSVLSDSSILSSIAGGYIKVEPFIEANVGPASIDLTLGNEFLVVKDPIGFIDMETPIEYDKVLTDEFILRPGEFVLASTIEYIGLSSNVCGFISGRSSVGRMGLCVENAGFVDPGWEGRFTLELYNANKYGIKLKAGRRICQIILSNLDLPSSNPYDGKYKNSKGTVGSKIFEDKK